MSKHAANMCQTRQSHVEFANYAIIDIQALNYATRLTLAPSCTIMILPFLTLSWHNHRQLKHVRIQQQASKTARAAAGF
jgi:hypothetical protein